MYGNFRLDIFDFFTAPILVVSGTFSSTQTISPLNMTFTSFSFYPTPSTQSATLLSSSYNTTLSLSFTLSYTAPPQSRLSLTLSTMTFLGPPALSLPIPTANTTLLSWNATYADFMLALPRSLGMGTLLTVNISGYNVAPRAVMQGNTVRVTMSNGANVVVQKCESWGMAMGAGGF